MFETFTPMYGYFIPAPEEMEEVDPTPELVAECWQTEPADGQKCIDAMRALCRGNSLS